MGRVQSNLMQMRQQRRRGNRVVCSMHKRGGSLRQSAKNWLLTIAHSHSESRVIEMDIMNLQDMHEELVRRSAYCLKEGKKLI